MEAITDLITLQNAVIALIILVSIWLLKIVIKKEYEHLIRVLLILIILCTVLSIMQKKDRTVPFLSDIKKKFFPEKTLQYTYHIERNTVGHTTYTQYIFKDPKPKLALSVDSSGETFHITDISPINDVLDYLDLPGIHAAVPELSTVTGSQFDINHYRWDHYPLGALLIERALCKDKNKLTFYNCILRVIVEER